MNGLMGSTKVSPLPKHSSAGILVNDFNVYYVSKVKAIREGLDAMIASGDVTAHTSETSSFVSSHGDAACLRVFDPVNADQIKSIIIASPTKSCELDPLPTSLLKLVVDILAVPIATIVNLSLSSGVVPSSLKLGLVSPLLKKASLDPDVLANYRPVTNLSFLSKVLERVVCSQLTEHQSIFNLLSPCQSAYRPHHSTETALLSLCNDILMSLDSGKASALLLLDLSAAFDTIDHGILIARLKNLFGVSDIALQWFQSYLAGRSQSVVLKGVKSESAPLLYGVPQGSVLGPILFVDYVNPVHDIAVRHGVSDQQFSDDLQLLVDFALTPQCTEQNLTLSTLAACAAETEDWFTLNRVKPNIQKSTFMYFITPRKSGLHNVPLSVRGSSLIADASARNLGVILDSNLSMEVQVRSICRSAYFHIRMIGKVRKYLSLEAAKCLAHSLVLSRLDYANSLLIGLPNDLLDRLQKVQNAAARLVLGVGRKEDSSQSMLLNLHWLDVRKRIELKINVLTFRCLKGIAPVYLSKHIVPYVPARPLRSANTASLCIPPTILKSYGDRAFSVVAPKLWNSLPSYVREAESLKDFKTQLITYFARSL